MNRSELRRLESGQTMAEYAIVIAVITVGIILALTVLGGQISAALNAISAQI